VKPRRHADLGSSNLHFSVRAGHPDLFRSRFGLHLPVHRTGDGGAHFGEPPLRPRHACFATPAENRGGRSVESKFELFVGCHNVFIYYDSSFAEQVGQRLSNLKNFGNLFGGDFEENIEHSTSNTEHRTTNEDIGCWEFSVGR
jgi:hypothetical protein